MKALDFLSITSDNEVRYSDYILFKKGETVTAEMFGCDAYPGRLVSGSIPEKTAVVAVYDESALLGYLNEAGATADAAVRIEDEALPHFVFIYSLE